MVNGKLIRQLRNERNMSAQELARRIGCAPSLIIQVETDPRRSLSTKNLKNLVMELGTSADLLLGITGDDVVFQNAYKRARKNICRRISEVTK